MAIKCIIHISGNWCDGYWWELLNAETGFVVKEDGPYHKSRIENAKQQACEDAEEYASKNDIEVIGYA